MVTARLIVCERTGKWAGALRRELTRRLGVAGIVPLRETRTLDECSEVLVRWPASLAALELTAHHVAAVLDWTAEVTVRFPAALVVILLPADLAEAQWALREAGAALVARSRRELASVADLAIRHLQLAPRTQLSRMDEIIASLPWSD
jgi:hypothetical protein